jgi:predicted DNA-binding transcriptional regulator AlpA
MTTLLTLKEFLVQNRISRATFYRLPAEDKPKTVRISRKILIHPEDADAWQRRMARAER